MSDPNSKPKHSVWIDYNVRVPMRDGVELSANVFRPVESREGVRFPVILSRTPYNKVAEVRFKAGNYYAQNGYVFVWLDVRGRGDSDGRFVPYRSEGQDGYDAIEWCAAQAWSTGKVGTFGGSYPGMIQWLAALEKPPHLATMIVLVSPSDPFVEWPNGVHGPMHLCWLHLVSGRLSQNIDVQDWDTVYRHLPLLSMDEASGRPDPVWREELGHQTRDEFWEPLYYQDKFDRIDLPVMHVSGWYDDEQIGTPLNFQGMTSHGATELARKSQKLLMGPWGHEVNASRTLGEVDFGPEAVIDLRNAFVRWFDCWLRGEENGVRSEPPVRIFVMGENRWRDEFEWPPARARFTPYYLHSGGRANSRFGDGSLSTAPPAAESADHYHSDPNRPVPFLTDPRSSQIGGPDDYAAVERRDDVLVYMTPPLEEDLEVTGSVRCTLYAASSVRDTDFMAKLVDVHPSGFVQRLCDGMVRARYRNGNDRVELIEPGQVYRYEIDVWNTAQVFLKGHRVGLEIASSAFPKYDRNAQTGEDLATETTLLPADQTIYHDADHPTAIILPIIPKTA